jgi:hypothetical protein
MLDIFQDLPNYFCGNNGCLTLLFLANQIYKEALQNIKVIETGMFKVPISWFWCLHISKV